MLLFCITLFFASAALIPVDLDLGFKANIMFGMACLLSLLCFSFWLLYDAGAHPMIIATERDLKIQKKSQAPFFCCLKIRSVDT